MPELSGSRTVTVVKYRLLEYGEQIRQVRDLLLESSFPQRLSSFVTGFGREIYDINADFNDGRRLLSTRCLSGDDISASNQFNGRHLKNNHAEWVSSLERILAEFQHDSCSYPVN